MSVLIDIAKDVTAALTAATLSLEFTAVRAYRPTYDLKDMDTLHVTVVPKDIATRPSTRTQMKGTYLVDVAVQQKVDPADLETCDGLMELVKEIKELFLLKRLDGDTTAACTDVENSPIYSPAHMSEKRQFTSVLTFTFQA